MADKSLLEPHGFGDSVLWRLAPTGLVVLPDEVPVTTGGPPATVRRVWNTFGPAIVAASDEYKVPFELIIATICTESRGNPVAERAEPGFVDYDTTPHRVSIGLMQTLISTARDAMKGKVKATAIDPDWLRVPANSIRAGTAYIASQKKATGFDPPKVACAYNAGGLHPNQGAGNRWKMRQFPIGTGAHADRFVAWFNDCFVAFDDLAALPAQSLIRIAQG